MGNGLHGCRMDISGHLQHFDNDSQQARCEIQLLDRNPMRKRQTLDMAYRHRDMAV